MHLIDLLEVHGAALVDLCFGALSKLFVELGPDKGLVYIIFYVGELIPPVTTCGVVFTECGDANILCWVMDTAD